MARLTSIEKGGFYAFPSEFLPHVASLFEASKGGKILDPCAGEGEALEHLSSTWQLTPYANELDFGRSAACVEKFGAVQAVQGDMYNLRTSSNAFVAAWVNPPYVWDAAAGSDEKRRELSFLKHSLKWVQPGGFMIWVVYAHHVTQDAALVLAKNCSQVDIWGVPGLHLGEYKQVVVVGQIGRSEQPIEARIMDILKQAQQPRSLEMQTEPIYKFPAPRPARRERFLFAPKIMTPEITLAAIQTASVHQTAQFQAILQPPPPIEDIRPIVQPRGMQIGLVLAAGMFNGLILETEEHGRVAVRSTIRTVEQLQQAVEVNEDDAAAGATEREVYRTKPIVTITLLTETGEMIPISGDIGLVHFIRDHKPALLDYLERHFKPLYNFDYSPIEPVLNRVRIGKNGLFTTQKHVIAAAYTALQQRKGLYLVGEPGTGKVRRMAA